ncbi:HAD family hydrolase [Microbacterium arabinogalactanolyticum]|uniref:HAD family hydrolase n=1 Tax=Microbacterium arabinogalactanolyticum TaxID=69365 RepID=UPI004044E26F
MSPLPAAVLFDLDGTLIDSEGLWLDVIDARLASAGLPSAHLPRFEGVTSIDAARLLQELGAEGDGVQLLAAQLEQQAVDAFDSRLTWVPGAPDALQALREAGIPLGLVTSSTREWVTTAERSLTLGRFDAIVTVEDVVHPKPNPEPYRRAAELLGVDPGDCVVFEDSLVGLRSATDAGFPVVRIGAAPTSGPLPLTTLADHRGFSVRWLRQLLQPARASA